MPDGAAALAATADAPVVAPELLTLPGLAERALYVLSAEVYVVAFVSTAALPWASDRRAALLARARWVLEAACGGIGVTVAELGKRTAEVQLALRRVMNGYDAAAAFAPGVKAHDVRVAGQFVTDADAVAAAEADAQDCNDAVHAWSYANEAMEVASRVEESLRSASVQVPADFLGEPGALTTPAGAAALESASNSHELGFVSVGELPLDATFEWTEEAVRAYAASDEQVDVFTVAAAATVEAARSVEGGAQEVGTAVTGTAVTGSAADAAGVAAKVAEPAFGASFGASERKPEASATDDGVGDDGKEAPKSEAPAGEFSPFGEATASAVKDSKGDDWGAQKVSGEPTDAAAFGFAPADELPAEIAKAGTGQAEPKPTSAVNGDIPKLSAPTASGGLGVVVPPPTGGGGSAAARRRRRRQTVGGAGVTAPLAGSDAGKPEAAKPEAAKPEAGVPEAAPSGGHAGGAGGPAASSPSPSGVGADGSDPGSAAGESRGHAPVQQSSPSVDVVVSESMAAQYATYVGVSPASFVKMCSPNCLRAFSSGAPERIVVEGTVAAAAKSGAARVALWLKTSAAIDEFSPESGAQLVEAPDGGGKVVLVDLPAAPSSPVAVLRYVAAKSFNPVVVRVSGKARVTATHVDMLANVQVNPRVKGPLRNVQVLLSVPAGDLAPVLSVASKPEAQWSHGRRQLLWSLPELTVAEPVMLKSRLFLDAPEGASAPERVLPAPVAVRFVQSSTTLCGCSIRVGKAAPSGDSAVATSFGEPVDAAVSCSLKIAVKP